MIDTLDRTNSDVASWSDDGKSFVVKDTDKFEREVIPLYFNHNKLSSFVRQLNFYGFRKMRSDSIRIKDSTPEESKYVRFYHEQDKFQRGRPDLLAEIRKASSSQHDASAVAEKAEVDALKVEIRDLRGQLSSTQMEVQKLRTLFANFMAFEHRHQSQPPPIVSHNVDEPPYKKVRYNDADLVQQQVDQVVPLPIGSIGPPPVPEIPGQDSWTRNESSGASSITPSFSPEEDRMLQSIIALDQDDQFIDDNKPNDDVLSLAAYGADRKLPASNSTGADPELVQKLRDTLASLPKEMQEQFVDRMVAFVASPAQVKKQVEALTALAAVAAEEARTRLASSSSNPGDNDPSADTHQTTELAGSILGAYLQKYMGRLQQQQQQLSSDVMGSSAAAPFAVGVVPAPAAAAPTPFDAIAPAPFDAIAPAPLDAIAPAPLDAVTPLDVNTAEPIPALAAADPAVF